ncbi:Arc family DNA-binding protein, partial [Burkholderia gladioli]
MAQDEYIKLQLRLPKELRDRVQASAEESGKSMNAELIGRIESSYSSAETISELRSALKALVEAAEGQNEAFKATKHLLRLTGHVMALSIGKHIDKGSASDEVDEIMRGYAEGIADNDLARALEYAERLRTFGVEAGFLTEDKKLKPEFAHLSFKAIRGVK